MGSTRVARRAGRQQASRPAARTNAVTPAKVSPSVAVTPNSRLSTTRVVAAAASSPRAPPPATSVPPCPDHQPHDVGAPRPQGHADAELAPAPGHRATEEAVEAERGEEQRHAREDARARRVEAGLDGLPRQHRVEGRRVDLGVGVDPPEHRPHQRNDRVGIALGADHHVRGGRVGGRVPLWLVRGQVDVADAGQARQVVEGRDVGDDADDLPLLAVAQADALSDGRLAAEPPPA